MVPSNQLKRIDWLVFPYGFLLQLPLKYNSIYFTHPFCIAMSLFVVYVLL